MPSRINTAMVAEYQKKLGPAPDFVSVDTVGLSVAQFTELRKLAREKGISVFVVKTTLAAIALKDIPAREGGANGESDALQGVLAGQTALVYGGEGLPAIARLVSDYAKKSGKLAIRGGVFEKQVLTAAQVNRFRDIPDRNTLLSQVLSTIVAPLTGVLGLTQNLLSSPAALADALARKQEAPAA
jgi:large subunit ribosomal protein L10